MKKNGQAALDYLTTYGWALIALSVALGAIYLFLDYSPDNMIPETCSFGDSFNCLDFKINSTSNVIELHLNNAVGTEINVTALSCTYVGEKVTDKCTEDKCVAYGLPIDCCSVGPGEDFVAFCNMTPADITFKKKSKLDVTLVYFKKGMSFPSSSDGFISGTVMK